MEDNEKNKIITNLHYLAENTCNLPQLYNHCLQKKLLTFEEKETIKSNIPQYVELTEFYTAIVKKGGQSFDMLLTCLEESENPEIVNKLRGDECHTDTVTKTKGNESFPIWYDIRPPTQYYVGREAQLVKIEKYWNETQNMNRFMFLAITGLAGIGKTDLAKTFLTKMYKEKKGNCIGINGESTQSVSDSFRGLATQLNIELRTADGRNKSLDKISTEVYQKLSQSNTYTIIFFDNVEKYEQPFLKTLIEFTHKIPPTEKKPFAILTSRYGPVQKQFGTLAIQIELDVLSQNEAEDFFKKSLIMPKNNKKVFKQVQELSEALKCHPLALRQSAAYIKEKVRSSSLKQTLEKYLLNFSQSDLNAKSLLNHQLPPYQQLGVTSTTTYLALKLSLEKIVSIPQTGPMAKNLLNVIAFFFAEKICTEFVMTVIEGCNFPQPQHSLPKTRKLEPNFFETLTDYSLCKLTEKEGVTTASLHRLVQMVIRMDLDDENQLNILDMLIGSIRNLFAANKIPIKEMIHVTTIWNHASKYIQLVKKYQEMPDIICQKYWDQEMYGELLDFSSKVVCVLESFLGYENRVPLRMVWRKGASLERLGKYDEALAVLTEAYGRQKSMLGKDFCDTVDTYNDIERVLHEQPQDEATMNWFKSL